MGKSLRIGLDVIRLLYANRDVGIMHKVFEDGRSFYIHLFHGYITCVDGASIALYDFGCWGIENGIPTHSFAPEILKEIDLAYLLLEEMRAVDQEFLEPHEQLRLIEMKRQLNESLAHVPAVGQTLTKQSQRVMRTFLDELVERYKANIWMK